MSKQTTTLHFGAHFGAHLGVVLWNDEYRFRPSGPYIRPSGFIIQRGGSVLQPSGDFRPQQRLFSFSSSLYTTRCLYLVSSRDCSHFQFLLSLYIFVRSRDCSHFQFLFIIFPGPYSETVMRSCSTIFTSQLSTETTPNTTSFSLIFIFQRAFTSSFSNSILQYFFT